MPFNQSYPKPTSPPHFPISINYHNIIVKMDTIATRTIVTTHILYDLHNVINLSVYVSHVLVLSYYLVNNKICLKQTEQEMRP